MRAVVVTEFGGPEVLQWLEVPDPVAGPGEVVVRVTASAVNRADLLQRQGFYPPPVGAPEYPGLECSGTVESVGDGVEAWSVGDPCTARTTLATIQCIDESAIDLDAISRQAIQIGKR